MGHQISEEERRELERRLADSGRDLRTEEEREDWLRKARQLHAEELAGEDERAARATGERPPDDEEPSTVPGEPAGEPSGSVSAEPGALDDEHRHELMSERTEHEVGSAYEPGTDDRREAGERAWTPPHVDARKVDAQQDGAPRVDEEQPAQGLAGEVPEEGRAPASEEAPAPAPRRHSRRGFASMDAMRQREIASMGGRASHAYGRGHEFTSEEAREAGRRGGRARWDEEAERRKAAGSAPRAPSEPPREGGRQRGFASLGQEQLREVARRGGRAAHESGHAHEFSSEEARKAAKERWHH